MDAATITGSIVASEFDAYPECTADVTDVPWYMRHPGDGGCAPQLNTPECGFDGGDCAEFNEKYPDCKPDVDDITFSYRAYDPFRFWTAFLNDAECQRALNTEDCGFGGGELKSFSRMSQQHTSP